MQNDVRLHLCDNEQRQLELEELKAKAIQSCYESNLAAFKAHMPNVALAIEARASSKFSIIVDDNGELNIVNITTGMTFYNFDVDCEIKKQVDNAQLHSALVNWTKIDDLDETILDGQKLGTYKQDFSSFRQASDALKSDLDSTAIDTLVIFGIGKGAHLAALVERSQANNVVIYEPSWDLFYCSLFCCDWHGILHNAQARAARIFIQFNKNAASLHEDLIELNEVYPLANIWFYQHYNEPSFCAVMAQLRHKQSRCLLSGVDHEPLTDFQSWVSPWTPSVDISKWQIIDETDTRYQKNQRALRKYFPDLSKGYQDYEFLVWQVIQHADTKEINLFNTHSCTFLSVEKAKEAGKRLSRHFSRYPNQDGLVFGYESDKQKHYLHNVFIRRTATLLKSQQYEKASLPEKVRSLILVGIEAGYTIQSLYDELKEIKHAFICEPNPDFFYASMFAIDWHKILKKVDKQKSRIYLNVGEHGSLLYSDLNHQFMRIGADLLSDTYFFQAYHNAPLARMIRDLREQLMITFTLTENLDHVVYGLAHTQEALRRKLPVMLKDAEKRIHRRTRNLPVFIVGNGPSLDQSITLLKEYRNQVLVVSCGTALQALHSYGITPDFHAEIEQCRATFDWPSRINDPEYLKAITFVSVNGLHPDTSELFKDTLFAFKSGESSTVATLNMLGHENFAMLERAFPTVTNLALNFFLKLGFNSLYLLGVDLGFVDYKKHHSSQSGYYEAGKQIYDYEDGLAKSLPVKGNFRDLVYTKAEFNLSRSTMEQSLQGAKADCYNLSDGVYIQGTVPLQGDEVLICNEPVDRELVMGDIKEGFAVLSIDIQTAFDEFYSKDLLNSRFDRLKALCSSSPTKPKQVRKLIKELRNLAFEQDEKSSSLFLYYIIGSLNNLCATLRKSLMAQDKSQAMKHVDLILSYWLRLVEDAQAMINMPGELFDSSASHCERRERLLLDNQAKNETSSTISIFAFDMHLSDYLQVDLPSNCVIARTKSDFLKNNSDGLLSRRIFVISTEEHLRAYKQMLLALKIHHEPNDKIENHLLVYTEASLSELIEKEIVSQQAENACCLFMPLMSFDLAKVEGGEMPLAKRSDAVHFMLARLSDTSIYSHIIYRAKFFESGLNRAYAKQEDEYLSEAVDYLAMHFSHMLAKRPAYLFKKYVAFTKRPEPEPSMLDTFNNRGLHIHRPLVPYELLGEWYKAAEAEVILNEFKEHINGV